MKHQSLHKTYMANHAIRQEMSILIVSYREAVKDLQAGADDPEELIENLIRDTKRAEIVYQRGLSNGQ